MRLFIFTILVVISLVSFSQEIIIDENYVDKPLAKIIYELQDQYQLKLAFSRSAILRIFL